MRSFCRRRREKKIDVPGLFMLLKVSGLGLVLQYSCVLEPIT
jgi:hypothetical protein